MTGVVLASPRARGSVIERLKAMGFTPFTSDGAVYNACYLADPTLLPAYHADAPQLPVVGYISDGAWLHDHAASSLIVTEAGGIATALDGGDLKTSEGPSGCVMASSRSIHTQLLEAVQN